MPVEISKENIIKIPHNLIVKIQAVYDNLKTAEKKVADLLLNNPQYFSTATIVEASTKACCSEATFTRLSKRLGFKGYPELKSALMEITDDDRIVPYENILDEDSCDTAVAKVFEAAIQSLRDTLNILDINKYKAVVNALSKANKVMLCGSGDAFAVALSGYQKFIRIGFNATVSADIDVELIIASGLKKNDVVIAISHSGKTKSVVDIVKIAKNNGAKIISITNFPVSPLAKNSDIVLLTAAFSEHADGEIMAKRITELCILESIFVNVLLDNKTKLSTNVKKSNDALELNKLR
jgi:DNA-binding MurR/RpiR family transcriptional regulator